VTQTPSGSTAVMARRIEPPDALDFFPTPPWATRALLEHTSFDWPDISVWEPAAGEGHMAEVLRESCWRVHASDIHDYGRGYAVGDFTGGMPRAECPFRPDWVITNPPFNEAQAFLDRALGEARDGVALLLRLVWLEGGDRWRGVFRDRRPTSIHVFAERVPMAKGRWDPDGSTATAYAWFLWNVPALGRSHATELAWIPPGQREALTRPDDRRRFGCDADQAGDHGPLFGGAL
jgi:hypothetical protein